MSEDDRKATDILLSIESKLESLLNHHRTQELNLKILSNKFNSLIDSIPKLNSEKNLLPQQKIMIEAVDVAAAKSVPTNSINNMSIMTEPTGSRRISRQEEDIFIERGNDAQQNRESMIQKTVKAVSQLKDESVQKPSQLVHPNLNEETAIQLTQRLIDKNSKSIFLAEVEIKDNNDVTVHKTRTNSVGKWNATLPPGNYRIISRKQDKSSKQKIEVLQDLQLDGSQRSVNLQDFIIK